MSACRLLPYMTPLSHHVGECIARDRESPRKSPTSYVHTLYYGTITRTLSPFPPIKYTHPAGRSPSRRIENYSFSLSLSLSLSRSVDADARRPTIDRARARSSLSSSTRRTLGRAGGRDAFDSNRVRLTTRARANRIVRARRRRRRRRRANAKAVREEDGRHRWRLAVAQSTR